MDIIEFLQSDNSLEKKEDEFHKYIDFIDKESFDLFSEIVDLSDESLYKLYTIENRIYKLVILYSLIEKSIDLLNESESNSYTILVKKHLLKRLINVMITILSSLINLLLGAVTFIYFNRKTDKWFAEEVTKIFDAIEVIDEQRINSLRITLGNCIRLYNGKKKKIINRLVEELSQEKTTIMDANDRIRAFITSQVSIEEINDLPSEIKDKMISILRTDLNDNSHNLENLLNSAKDENNCFIRKFVINKSIE